MPIVLALLASVLYGTADFIGGLGSRRMGTFAVSIVSQCTGVLVILTLAALLGARHVSQRDLLWGAAAGFTGIGGLLLLYHGLAQGPMSVVAPTTALCSMALPVLVGLALGERPSRSAVAGAGLAVLAVLLISQQGLPDGASEDRHRRVGRAVAISLLAGVLIAMFLVCFARTSRDAGYWPLVVGRLASFSSVLLLVAVRRERDITGRWRRAPRGTLALVVLAGALDNVANVFYTTAARVHYLSITAPLASLYPAATVLLARYTLDERLRRVQVVGLAAAGAAIVLMTL